jgi:capsular exopolysaccharide synthesis family protein
MLNKEIHLRDYIRVILKKKSIIITFFLITFMVVVVGTFTATPQYLASTKVFIEKNEVNPLYGGRYYTPEDMQFNETQSQIIKSKSVARKVVKNLELGKYFKSYFPDEFAKPGFLQIVVGKIKKSVGDFINSAKKRSDLTEVVSAPSDEGYEAYQYDWIVDIISSGINVTPVKESRIFVISFMSENPIFARRVSNSVVKAYQEELLELKAAASGRTIKWMTQKADEERDKLKESEDYLQKYMRDNDIVTIEDRITVVPQKLAEFSSQLSRAEAKRKELFSIYKQVQEAANDSSASLEAIPAIINDRSIQDIRNNIQQVQQKIIELSKKYGPKHPLMIKAQSEQENLLEKKQEEIKRVRDSIKNEYELAQANEDNLRNLLEKTKADALGLNEKFIQYQVLKREVESNRAMYEALFSRLKEQNVTEESQNVNVWVVEKAETPIKPAKPNKSINIFLGLVFGLCGGIGLAFFTEYLDNTIKNPEEAEEQLGLPLLGVIDLCKFDNKDAKIGQELISLYEKYSTNVEAFKALRTSVLLSSSERPPKRILLTSMMPGEGKTLTAANLAVTIAQTGQQVLLIDGDMRKPRVHKIFKLDNSLGGLSTYLSGARNEEIRQQGPIASLSIIPAGPLPPNPSELLSSMRLKEFLDQQQNIYDMIIFDSAPIISVTDSLMISRVVDGVIVVTRAASTTYDVVRKGIRALTDVNANIIGMVVNGFDTKKYRYYYGKDYSQYYGKYYGAEEA